ncbi:MAG: hypothetical protein HQL20_10485 [Candidatus Omnitrophica bacterium]|nr:hypothetical protein [Candidatus Omnitrophota bacterium]
MFYTLANSMRKIITLLVLLVFLLNTLAPAWAVEGVFAVASPLSAIQPVPLIQGIKVFPSEPFRFEFIVERGKPAEGIVPAGLKDVDTKRLVKYFFTALAMPERDMWVNLSPLEPDRIVPADFGRTDMGRDLLAQDLILKQITAASLTPDSQTGRIFWDRVYARLRRDPVLAGAEIPMDAVSKVWISPDKAVVYENSAAGASALILKARLKVMVGADPKLELTAPQTLARQVMREVLIPVLEDEVNNGAAFAPLRQAYHALILAAWYKDKIKNTILAQAYVDRGKIQGMERAASLGGSGRAVQAGLPDNRSPQEIYRDYISAYRTGLQGMIYEDADPDTGDLVPRKYATGGVVCAMPPPEVSQNSKEAQFIAGAFDGAARVAVLARPARVPVPRDASAQGLAEPQSLADFREAVRSTHVHSMLYMFRVFRKAGLLKYAENLDDRAIVQAVLGNEKVLNIGVESRSDSVYSPEYIKKDNLVTFLRRCGIQAVGISPLVSQDSQESGLLNGMAQNIPVEDGRFGWVVSINLFDPSYFTNTISSDRLLWGYEETMRPEYEQIALEVWRVLKPGGKFLFDPMGDNYLFVEALQARGFDIQYERDSLNRKLYFCTKPATAVQEANAAQAPVDASAKGLADPQPSVDAVPLLDVSNGVQVASMRKITELQKRSTQEIRKMLERGELPFPERFDWVHAMEVPWSEIIFKSNPFTKPKYWFQFNYWYNQIVVRKQALLMFADILKAQERATDDFGPEKFRKALEDMHAALTGKTTGYAYYREYWRMDYVYDELAEGEPGKIAAFYRVFQEVLLARKVQPLPLVLTEGLLKLTGEILYKFWDLGHNSTGGWRGGYPWQYANESLINNVVNGLCRLLGGKDGYSFNMVISKDELVRHFLRSTPVPATAVQGANAAQAPVDASAQGFEDPQPSGDAVPLLDVPNGVQVASREDITELQKRSTQEIRDMLERGELPFPERFDWVHAMEVPWTEIITESNSFIKPKRWVQFNYWYNQIVVRKQALLMIADIVKAQDRATDDFGPEKFRKALEDMHAALTGKTTGYAYYRDYWHMKDVSDRLKEGAPGKLSAFYQVFQEVLLARKAQPVPVVLTEELLNLTGEILYKFWDLSHNPSYTWHGYPWKFANESLINNVVNGLCRLLGAKDGYSFDRLISKDEFARHFLRSASVSVTAVQGANAAQAPVDASAQGFEDPKTSADDLGERHSEHIPVMLNMLRDFRKAGLLKYAENLDDRAIVQAVFGDEEVLNIGLESGYTSMLEEYLAKHNIVTYLRRRDIKAVGISPLVSKESQENGFLHGKAQNIPAEDGRFGWVVSIYLFDPTYFSISTVLPDGQRVEDKDVMRREYEQIASEVWRVLKPGGKFMFDPRGDNPLLVEALRAQHFIIQEVRIASEIAIYVCTKPAKAVQGANAAQAPVDASAQGMDFEMVKGLERVAEAPIVTRVKDERLLAKAIKTRAFRAATGLDLQVGLQRVVNYDSEVFPLNTAALAAGLRDVGNGNIHVWGAETPGSLAGAHIRSAGLLKFIQLQARKVVLSVPADNEIKDAFVVVNREGRILHLIIGRARAGQAVEVYETPKVRLDSAIGGKTLAGAQQELLSRGVGVLRQAGFTEQALAEALAKGQSFSSAGLDINIAPFQGILPEGVQVIESDFNSVGVLRDLDLVLTANILPYLAGDERNAVLHNMWRALKEGGVIVSLMDDGVGRVYKRHEGGVDLVATFQPNPSLDPEQWFTAVPGSARPSQEGNPAQATDASAVNDDNEPLLEMITGREIKGMDDAWYSFVKTSTDSVPGRVGNVRRDTFQIRAQDGALMGRLVMDATHSYGYGAPKVRVVVLRELFFEPGVDERLAHSLWLGFLELLPEQITLRYADFNNRGLLAELLQMAGNAVETAVVAVRKHPKQSVNPELLLARERVKNLGGVDRWTMDDVRAVQWFLGHYHEQQNKQKLRFGPRAGLTDLFGLTSIAQALKRAQYVLRGDLVRENKADTTRVSFDVNYQRASETYYIETRPKRREASRPLSRHSEDKLTPSGAESMPLAGLETSALMLPFNADDLVKKGFLEHQLNGEPYLFVLREGKSELNKKLTNRLWVDVFDLSHEKRINVGRICVRLDRNKREAFLDTSFQPEFLTLDSLHRQGAAEDDYGIDGREFALYTSRYPSEALSTEESLLYGTDDQNHMRGLDALWVEPPYRSQRHLENGGIGSCLMEGVLAYLKAQGLQYLHIRPSTTSASQRFYTSYFHARRTISKEYPLIIELVADKPADGGAGLEPADGAARDGGIDFAVAQAGLDIRRGGAVDNAAFVNPARGLLRLSGLIPIIVSTRPAGDMSDFTGPSR